MQEMGPRKLPTPTAWLFHMGGQEEAHAADPVKSAGFTQLGFVTWRTVKYLPDLSMSVAASMARCVMKYPVKFWQFQRCGNHGACKGPVGSIATEALVLGLQDAPGGRRRVEGTLDS